MKQFISWLATKNFILVDLMLIAVLSVLLYASWPSLQSYSRYTAIAVLAIMVALAVIGLGVLVIQVVFMTERKVIDMQVYRRDQLSLPLSSLPATKIIEEDAISAPLQKKLLPRRRHVLQRLHPAKVPSATPANPQGANLQKPFATGYRPPSNAIANPQDANLQPANLQPLDDIDAKILQAKNELQSQGLKPTGTAIAKMTGIAERTVYDRSEKMRQR